MADTNILDQFKENHETKVIDTSKKLKVGIIGTGWIAEKMAITLEGMEGDADLVDGRAFQQQRQQKPSLKSGR